MLDGADLHRADLSSAQFVHCGQLIMARSCEIGAAQNGAAKVDNAVRDAETRLPYHLMTEGKDGA